MISHSAYDTDLLISGPSFDGGDDSATLTRDTRRSKELPFIEEKIRIPEIAGLIDRPRISTLMSRSSERFVANLVSGRARTGKSSAAAAFSSQYKRVAWYTLDLTDNSWPVFSNYFAASVLRATSDQDLSHRFALATSAPTTDEIAQYLVRLLPCTYSGAVGDPLLLVLDDVHHIFDAAWFQDFFSFLLYSLPPAVHLLLLARGKPPLPLWRLRSKQLLNVIDETTLAFDRAETEKLCKKLGLPKASVSRVLAASFGRVGQIVNMAAAKTASAR